MALYTRTLSGQTIVKTSPLTHLVITDMDFASYGTGMMRLSITGGQSTFDINTPNSALITAIIADPGQSQTSALTGTVTELYNSPNEENASPGDGTGYTPLDFGQDAFGDPPYYIDFAGPGVAKSLYFWAPAFSGYNVVAYFKDYVITLESLGPTATVDSPPAGNIDPGAAVVVQGTTAGTIENMVLTVTDVTGVPVTVFTTSDGFEPGFSGSVAAITGGVKITATCDIGWNYGPLTASITATDDTPASATATASWTVGPTLPIEGAPDLITQARSRVIIQYRQSAKLLRIIDLVISPLQALANLLVKVPTLDDPTVATGVNLDVYGDIVGQSRELASGDTATDSEYQVLITARKSRNVSKCTGPNFIDIITTLLGAGIQLTDHGGMAISYIVLRQPTADEIAVLNEDILARPMGVNVNRYWAPTNYFGFSDDPAALGFADTEGAVGGTMAESF